MTKMTSINFTRIVWLAVVFVACMRSNAAIEIATEATSPDVLRASYMRFEQELWSTIENGVDQSSVGQHIFDEYWKFVAANLTEDYRGNSYLFMERVYEWKLLETDILIVNTTFDLFRPKLETRFDKTDRNTIIGWAENVVYNLNERLSQMEYIITTQGLYYRLSLVSFDGRCSCFVLFLTLSFVTF